MRMIDPRFKSKFKSVGFLSAYAAIEQKKHPCQQKDYFLHRPQIIYAHASHISNIITKWADLQQLTY